MKRALTILGRWSSIRSTPSGRSRFLPSASLNLATSRSTNWISNTPTLRKEPHARRASEWSVLQGAFTLWNLQAAASLTADLKDISIGRKLLPASGGGVFLAGFAQETVDSLEVSQLATGSIFTRGQIVPGPPGSTVYIACGVGISFGAHVVHVHNEGSVTTYGDFDMVLDNWGTVDSWIAEKPLTSYGKETAIGLVNYGTIGEVSVRAAIETFGRGSRGFNEYHGSIQRAEFDRITTHGDAAPGIQLGCPVKQLVVHRESRLLGGAARRSSPGSSSNYLLMA